MPVESEQVLLTKMEYAMKSLSLLSSKSISKCVSVSTSVTQQLFSGPVTKLRPYRVSNWDRSIKKGIMADSLRDLLNKVQDTLLVTSAITLVLDEDGTDVDTEEFFQSLDSGSILMVLEKGQKWRPSESARYWFSSSNKSRRIDVARVTFDLYKMNPRDFIGCLNVKATLYGTYSLSYDLQCYGAKRIMKEALRWGLFTMQATGHMLLGTSCYMQQLLDATERELPLEEKPSSARKALIPSC
ncbi:cell death activator CIDE-3 isoform X1 [Rhinatrema bivittatum]|uniref:cell death activator CIDE-3 isoform X1 n=1 Tax=Rhinatrema bivittatum TaxID=194408 RepID=UPI00112E8DD5|nr:cell death activator CIDE-3 isoform X1 [Rhinatrema bivittatum]